MPDSGPTRRHNLRLNFGPRLERFAFRPLEHDRRINILEGAVRSGKTWALHPKILSACLYPVNGWRVLTGVSKQTIFQNVLGDLFSLIGPENYTYNHQSGLLRLMDSNWLVIGAKDEGSDKYIQGLTCGIAICDELTKMPLSFFHMLLSRMSPAGARLYATCNADSPYHWLKEHYLDKEELKTLGILWSGHYMMDDNPNLSQEYIESQKKLYSGVFYQRYILGLWVIAEGSIYRDVLGPQCEFDDSTRPIGLYSAYGARYIPVDYGTTNPCTFSDVYDDGKVMWEDKEYYWDSRKEMRQKTDDEYVNDLIEFIGPNRRGLMVIVDPSAASFKVACIKRGLPVRDAVNDVEEGIRKTSSALKAGLYKINRKRCPKTWSEMESYAWDDKAAARGEEAPLKINDHAPDRVRYCVHTMMPSWRVA